MPAGTSGQVGGPKTGRKCFVTPASSGVPNAKRGEKTRSGHGWAVSSVWVRDPPPPPPLRALRAHLVTKGQWLPAIHMVAPKAPEKFFHSPCQHSIPPRPGGGAPQRYT